MNVLHIDEQTGWRGGEQQASYLIRGLAERGHAITIAGRPRSPFLTEEHGAGILDRIAAPFFTELDLWTAWKLAQTVRRNAIDILHAHTSHAHTAACLARRLAGRGKVVVSRRVDFVPTRHIFNRWKYAQPDHIVAVSHAIAAVMRRFGVPETKLSVVHSCLDPARFDVPPLSRKELGVPDDAPLLGNVAALVGHKDHATLLDAMPTVLGELPDVRLIIVGEGELRPHAENRIRELGLGDVVTLLGYRKDVPRILRTLDAFVLSSKMEGLGSVVLEAMICGVPVVATCAGGVPETVRHEETGLLVPPQNPQALGAAIVRVLQDKVLAKSLAENGKALVLAQFTVDKMIEGNLRVYERLLESG